MRIIVVGAGLFGSIIAEALSKDGHELVVLDAMKPMGGSKPSACLMKPSWFSGMGKEKYEPALALLDECFGLEDLEFRIRPSGITSIVHRINPYTSLYINQVDKYVHTEVCHIGHDFVETPDKVFEADRIVVAAGVWCNELLRTRHDIQPKAGVALRYSGANATENRISVFPLSMGPYSQTVGFQETPHSVWIGDGSAILKKNWSEERIQSSIERCTKFADSLGIKNQIFTAVQGLRPYVKGVKPCLLEQVRPKVWLATGGAKNGTIAAGWAACELRKEFS